MIKLFDYMLAISAIMDSVSSVQSLSANETVAKMTTLGGLLIDANPIAMMNTEFEIAFLLSKQPGPFDNQYQMQFPLQLKKSRNGTDRFSK